ncbi:hypothetical protein BXZ70DRAFT_1004276 [Cristinia sonorae]|uniref:Microbial-type PARG catalytic domain-containing protein n=1 Tax=Cristinia sonorae TaxID=1940300 RepID=A0A8K0XTX1_9AGAR|nr:hypothetical protein BXZ70DRAFT_1004276 [Cristinia sonorae]
MSSWSLRKKISEDTLARIPAILHEVREGSSDSTFISEQLPPLPKEKCPNHPPTKIRVLNTDSFTAARNIMRNAVEAGDNADGKVAVLNLASDLQPGGGWAQTLSRTQASSSTEEALCYSSTLYPTLQDRWYPWPNVGNGSVSGIFSPRVVIFKDDLDHNCVDLEPSERRVVSVITVAAPRSPRLTNGRIVPQTLEWFREKIRLVYRMAAHNGREYLVLAAMGCGAYRCPAPHVAEEMKEILLQSEFKGWFREVVFAVYATDRNSNFDTFEEVLDGVEINGELTSTKSLYNTFQRLYHRVV